MVKWLQQIHVGKTQAPPRLLIYGTEGIGKTTFAAHAPHPVFIQTEDGVDAIDCHAFPLAHRLEDVRAALAELHSESHEYETVVIDSLDWLEQLIWDRLCADYGVRHIEQVGGGYGRCYTYALRYWREILDALMRLRNDRAMAVILVAHSKIERVEDPVMMAYDRYSPSLQKLATALVSEWVDVILFAHWAHRTRSEDGTCGRERHIAVPIDANGPNRVVHTVGGPGWIAKSRYALPRTLPLEWNAFAAALQNGYVPK